MTPSMTALLDHLRATPGGATKDDLVKVLPIGFHQIQKLVGRMASSGTIAFVVSGGEGKDNHTRRYYAIEHSPVSGKGAAIVPTRRTKQRTAAPKIGFKDSEARITSETKVTICAPFVDRRFAFDPPPGWKGEVTLAWEQERGL